MEAINTENINPDSVIGQVTLLLVSLAIVGKTFRPLIQSPKEFKNRRSNKAISEELKIAKKELEYSRTLRRDLTDWQLAARELIRVMKLEIIEAGGHVTGRMQQLSDMLDEIENRSFTSLNSEDITNGEND